MFTELFTVRYTVVTIGSAPGYGHSGSPSSSTGQEGGEGARGGVLEWRTFSPDITEVISKTLLVKDTVLYCMYTRMSLVCLRARVLYCKSLFFVLDFKKVLCRGGRVG